MAPFLDLYNLLSDDDYDYREEGFGPETYLFTPFRSAARDLTERAEAIFQDVFDFFDDVFDTVTGPGAGEAEIPLAVDDSFSIPGGPPPFAEWDGMIFVGDVLDNDTSGQGRTVVTDLEVGSSSFDAVFEITENGRLFVDPVGDLPMDGEAGLSYRITDDAGNVAEADVSVAVDAELSAPRIGALVGNGPISFVFDPVVEELLV